MIIRQRKDSKVAVTLTDKQKKLIIDKNFGHIATINKDQANRNQIFGNAYAEILFGKSLTLRNEVTGSFSMATEDRFNPSYTMGLVKNTSNSGSYNYGQNMYTTIRNYLTYSHTFNERYNANVMVGLEAQLS